MKPQQDLAAMLEGDDWTDDPVSGGEPESAPPKKRRRGEDPQQPGTSENGIQDLLSGYLKDDSEK